MVSKIKQETSSLLGSRDFKTSSKKATDILKRDVNIKKLNQELVKLKNLQQMRKNEKEKHRYAYEHLGVDKKIDNQFFDKYF